MGKWKKSDKFSDETKETKKEEKDVKEKNDDKDSMCSEEIEEKGEQLMEREETLERKQSIADSGNESDKSESDIEIVSIDELMAEHSIEAQTGSSCPHTEQKKPSVESFLSKAFTGDRKTCLESLKNCVQNIIQRRWSSVPSEIENGSENLTDNGPQTELTGEKNENEPLEVTEVETKLEQLEAESTVEEKVKEMNSNEQDLTVQPNDGIKETKKKTNKKKKNVKVSSGQNEDKMTDVAAEVEANIEPLPILKQLISPKKLKEFQSARKRNYERVYNLKFTKESPAEANNMKESKKVNVSTDQNEDSRASTFDERQFAVIGIALESNCRANGKYKNAKVTLKNKQTNEVTEVDTNIHDFLQSLNLSKPKDTDHLQNGPKTVTEIKLEPEPKVQRLRQQTKVVRFDDIKEAQNKKNKKPNVTLAGDAVNVVVEANVKVHNEVQSQSTFNSKDLAKKIENSAAENEEIKPEMRLPERTVDSIETDPIPVNDVDQIVRNMLWKLDIEKEIAETQIILDEVLKDVNQCLQQISMEVLEKAPRGIKIVPETEKEEFQKLHQFSEKLEAFIQENQDKFIYNLLDPFEKLERVEETVPVQPQNENEESEFVAVLDQDQIIYNLMVLK